MPGSLIFHHNGAGDYLLSLPAVRAIARFAPRPVHLVCGTAEGSFVYDAIAVDRLVRVDTWPGHFHHRFDAEAVPGLTPPYEWFVSVANWVNEDVQRLRARSGARWSAGLFSPFDVRPAGKDAAMVLHDIDRLYALAGLFDPGALNDDWLAPPAYPPAAERYAGEFATTIPEGATVLAVHGDTRPEKLWPLDRLDAALVALCAAVPSLVVVVVNQGARHLPRTARLDHVRFLTGVPLTHAMAATGRANYFLGIDSCMLHVADFHGIPGVALFGPTDPRQFGYRVLDAGRRVHLRPPSRTLRDLPVAEVVAAVRELVAR